MGKELKILRIMKTLLNQLLVKNYGKNANIKKEITQEHILELRLIYFYKNVYALNAEEFYVNKRDKEKDDDFDL